MPAFVYKLMVISIPADEDFYTDVYLKDLPKNWRSIGAYPTLQEIGSNWYKMKKSLILEVPSAIINQERNYIINTKHPDFKKNIKLVRTEDYFWDSRLL